MRAEQAERRARFLLDLRARGFRDLGLLRAMERAPRALFLPQRYEDLAWRDLALPIPCGETATPPFTVAAMIEALRLEPSHRVLEIGVGTGYSTALLAQCAREVVALERAEPLAAEAAARLNTLGHDNVEVAWADGLAPISGLGAFDRILVNALVDPSTGFLTGLLKPVGILVAAARREGGQRLWIQGPGMPVGGADAAIRTFVALKPGLVRAL